MQSRNDRVVFRSNPKPKHPFLSWDIMCTGVRNPVTKKNRTRIILYYRPTWSQLSSLIRKWLLTINSHRPTANSGPGSPLAITVRSSSSSYVLRPPLYALRLVPIRMKARKKCDRQRFPLFLLSAYPSIHSHNIFCFSCCRTTLVYIRHFCLLFESPFPVQLVASRQPYQRK